MSFYELDEPVPTSTTNRSAELGLYPTKHGKITLDAPLGFFAKQIMTDTAGDVVYRGKNGVISLIPNMQANQWYVAYFDMVLSEGTTWQGILADTVSGNIYFAGCE
jgi:hypothetical protein